MIHLAISFDRNYLTPFYVLLTSILKNNSDVKITFHCIVNDDVTIFEQRAIKDYIESNHCIYQMYQVDEELIAKFVLSGTWTPAVYYKMFFPILVPLSVEKLLYLDTDMLVIGDLKPLFEINLDDQALGAVYDNYVKNQPAIGILDDGNYFNSGMLLFNIPKWKELNLSEKAIDFLAQFPEKIKFVDQCALNAVSVGHWLRLPEKFNLLYSYIPQHISRKELNEFIQDKIVIHFTLQRPWHFLCENRLRNLYKYYYNLSPIENQPLILDFKFSKLKHFFKIRFKEFYFDSALIKIIWRLIK
jgi:lipopolysaccharide biosynthesis glycosyltransferase